MARQEANLRTCMVVQQLEDQYYHGWSAEELKAVELARVTGDLSGIMNIIGSRLFEKNIGAQEMHGIIHNEDYREVWSEVECNYTVEKKSEHFHIVIKFMDGATSTLQNIASAIGFELQAIEKAKKGKYSYDNMLSYLIHIKNPDKSQYDYKKVISCGLSDADGKPMYKQYVDIYREQKQDWEKGRAKVKAQQAKTDIDELEEMILTGQLTKSQVVLTDGYFTVYSRNARRCEDAFRVYGERRAYKTLQAMQNGEFKLSVFFITGVAGSGKTRMAKQFVDLLIKASSDYDEAWRVCQTAATNPMDDYNGEEILFMDDVRGSAMSASDWLKLLDPHNISPSSARYHNKVPACRAVIITSTKEPIEFFYYCKQMGGGDRSEALDQFMRRIQCLTKVIKADDFADAKALIAEGKSGNQYDVYIPNSSDGRGRPESVTLTHTFDDAVELSIEDAVDKLVTATLENNFQQTENKLDL